MSMLIRSQDKKELHNLDEIKMIKVVSLSNGHLVEVNSQHTIGTYSTEEKAIKVLDMIQDAYGHCVAGNIFMNGRIDRVNEMTNEAAEYCVREHIDMQVFQMPQDSEV